MKKTVQDNWRVVAVVRPQKTKMPVASLGFKDEWGNPLAGQVWGGPFEFTVHPSGPGFTAVGGWTYVQPHSGEEGCKVIRDGLLRHPNVTEARIECDEETTCSHCDCVWEELASVGEVDEFGQEDMLSVIGEPVCCTKAINEFRARQGIALLAD